ncbi:MAG: helix-turn-helix domain-containing protein [Clostridia bacterium]|nr:helix-turn-helix domain-containing protein [Clostridia bacterium]
MFHKAVDLKFQNGTTLEVTFQSGEVKSYDMSSLFDKYPQLRALENRKLFLSGKLEGVYGIVWNEDLDIEVETVYQEGLLVRKEKMPASMLVANAVSEARSKAGFTQSQLAAATGIDQSDISKIERGVSNPSVNTLSRIADALGADLQIVIS